MPSQRFRLHRSVHVVAALVLASVLAWPSAAAELPLNTTFRHAGYEPEPGEVAVAPFRVEIPQAGLLSLALTFAGGTQPAAPITLLVETRAAETFLVEVAALEPGRSLPAFKVRSAFQAADPAAVGTFIQKDVDPWDDDLDGKKPPPPPRVVVTAGSTLQLVAQDDGGLVVAFIQSEGEVESLNGDEAVYILILRRPTRP